MSSLGNDLCWHFYAGDQSLLALFNLASSLGASALFNHYKVRGRNLKKSSIQDRWSVAVFVFVIVVCHSLLLLAFTVLSSRHRDCQCTLSSSWADASRISLNVTVNTVVCQYLPFHRLQQFVGWVCYSNAIDQWMHSPKTNQKFTIFNKKLLKNPPHIFIPGLFLHEQ